MDSVQIKGYKSLQDVTLNRLGRVNYLVGSNGSGKSSILETLMLMGYGLNAPVDSGNFSAPGFSKHSIHEENGTEITLGRRGRLDLVMKIGPEAVVDTNGTIVIGRRSFLAKDPESISAEVLTQGSLRHEAAINARLASKQGFGIKTSYLSTRPLENNSHAITPAPIKLNLTQIDDTLKKSLLKFLNKYHAHPSGKKFVDINRAMQGDQAILLKLAEVGSNRKGEFYYNDTTTQHPIMSLSDGMRALLGLFYGIEEHLLYEQPIQDITRVVCIEEPEYGLHPDNQKRISTILNDFVTRYPDVVFFVTTHSPFVISRAAKFNDKKHRIYLLNNGQLNNLLGENITESIGFYGENCLNVVARMLGAGFDDLNAVPVTAETLTIVYCEGEKKEIKDSQLYKRIFRDENVVFVSAKSFREAVTAFRIGQQAAHFVFGGKTITRVLIDRSNGCPDCKPTNDHSSHDQEFTIATGINIKYTHKDHPTFDQAELERIEATEPGGRLRVLGRKELENYLFDPIVVALLNADQKNQLVIPEDIQYVNGEVKDHIQGKSAAIYEALANIIYVYKDNKTKNLYNELADYIGLAH